MQAIRPLELRRNRDATRGLALLTAAALAVAALVGVGPAPEATAAEASVSLGLETYADMAVDDARGHLFFTQGWGKDGVLVTTLDGARVTMITGMPGAHGLDLSADGTRLYVGLPAANAISVVDTQTLTEVERHATGDNTCPSDVAVAGSRVWYGYGCAGWANESGLGSLDLGAAPPVLRTWPEGGYYAAPMVSVAAGRLAMGEPGASPGIVATHDISSGEPRTLSLGRDVGENLNDIYLTPDGEQVLTASGVPYEHPVWRAQDMSAAGVYGSGAYPTSATTSADGSLVAVGTDSPSDTDIRVYRQGGSEPIRTWDFGRGTTLRLADRGLAFSADADRLFAVTTAPFSEDPQLHVLDDPGVAGSTLTISLPPGPKPGQEITVSGRLSFTGGAQPGRQNLLVTIENRDGYRQYDITTSENGAYSFTHTLRYGLTRFDVTYNGDAGHDGADAYASIHRPAKPWDLDMDGDADLAVGAPGEDIGSAKDAGKVAVLPGGRSGATGSGARSLSQNVAGVPGSAETGDRFGLALASGDVDRDEFPDLVVSAPGEDLGSHSDAGTVTLLPGSVDGADPSRSVSVDPLDLGQPAAGARFGEALTFGRFDGDTSEDLAVGAPGGDWVAVIPGRFGGFDLFAATVWRQGVDGVPGTSPAVPGRDRFGASLAAGDLNGDGYDDLAIGAPRDDEDRGYASGSVTVLYGGEQGLTAAGAQRWSRDSADVQGVPGTWDRATDDAPDDFGAHVSVADHDGDGYDDLVAAAPGAPRVHRGARQADAGSVSVLYGSPAGVTARDQLLARGRLGIPGRPRADDHFGAALAAGDLHRDGHADLAVTAAGQRSVMVVPGSASGFGPVGASRYDQDTSGVPGTDEAEDRFGAALLMGQFDRNRYDDLAIGVPGENRRRGAVVLLYARSSSGLATSGATLLSQGSPGVPDTPEAGDLFGSSL